jgi:hypothetical protein
LPSNSQRKLFSGTSVRLVETELADLDRLWGSWRLFEVGWNASNSTINGSVAKLCDFSMLVYEWQLKAAGDFPNDPGGHGCTA